MRIWVAPLSALNGDKTRGSSRTTDDVTDPAVQGDALFLPYKGASRFGAQDVAVETDLATAEVVGAGRVGGQWACGGKDALYVQDERRQQRAVSPEYAECQAAVGCFRSSATWMPVSIRACRERCSASAAGSASAATSPSSLRLARSSTPACNRGKFDNPGTLVPPGPRQIARRDAHSDVDQHKKGEVSTAAT